MAIWHYRVGAFWRFSSARWRIACELYWQAWLSLQWVRNDLVQTWYLSLELVAGTSIRSYGTRRRSRTFPPRRPRYQKVACACPERRACEGFEPISSRTNFSLVNFNLCCKRRCKSWPEKKKRNNPQSISLQKKNVMIVNHSVKFSTINGKISRLKKQELKMNNFREYRIFTSKCYKILMRFYCKLRW